MCGIAVVVSGIRIDLSSLLLDSIEATPPSDAQKFVFSVDDLEEALGRRGPDSLGTHKVLLPSPTSSSPNGTDWSTVGSFGELGFVGATLQLRGMNPIVQPLVDASGNVLVYNGEIYGGICIGPDSNDAEALMVSLGKCCSGDSLGLNSIPYVLSEIRGPWAMIYWQSGSRTLWFGRDAFGRRSLLVHWPTAEDSRLLLCSVSPSCFVEQNAVEDGINKHSYWEELPCGIYSISMGSSCSNGCRVGKLEKHEWTSRKLSDLIKWERTSVQPELEESYSSTSSDSGGRTASKSDSTLAQTVLMALKESVQRRTSQNTIFKAAESHEVAPVAVLFSGGLDSMILAALLDQCLDPNYEIDLLNVSFDGLSAPDRISSRAGVEELSKIASERRWNLVEIDADLSNLASEMKHVVSLIYPSNTYMDLNIGLALWLAAGGDGWLYNNESHQRVKYKSKSRVVLVGAGADEQCAGYGRHRTKYRHGSWLELHEEMKLDMQRIWKRNLGRDDRCIADNGKEARFPFLDEDVIRTLLDIPLWKVADLDQPSGTGDKKILREVAKMLSLHEAAVLPKRAIQFGSRIARESNRKNFGSNRAANQASAGSVVFHVPS